MLMGFGLTECCLFVEIVSCSFCRLFVDFGCCFEMKPFERNAVIVSHRNLTTTRALETYRMGRHEPEMKNSNISIRSCQ